MKQLVLYITLVFCCLNVLAGANDDAFNIFNQANELYADGKYDKAIELYQELVNQESHSHTLHFNLANAYFKAGENTLAILNYEKALKFKPDFEDALFNLKIANANTIDKIESAPEQIVSKTWKGLILSKTTDNWALFFITILFISVALFLSYLFSNQILIKKAGFYGSTFFLVLSLFCWLMANQSQTIKSQSSEAIIFSPSITITSEPNPAGKKLFTLHEGTKVEVLEKSGNYSKIKLPNGNIGWLTSENITLI